MLLTVNVSVRQDVISLVRTLFMRKKFVTDGVLQHFSMNYPFQLETISMTGIVVKLKDGATEPILPGERCFLSFNLNQVNDSFTISAQTVHYSFSLVALKFIDLDEISEQSLANIIEKVAGQLTGGGLHSSDFHYLR